jgi:hypothetical protein
MAIIAEGIMAIIAEGIGPSIGEQAGVVWPYAAAISQ